MASNVARSPCGAFQYARWETWEPSKPLLGYLGAWPNSADPVEVARGLEFAIRFGYGGALFLNCLAFVAGHPHAIMERRARGGDVVGPENDTYLALLAPTCGRVVACWGFNGPVLMHRQHAVTALVPKLWAFGKTEGGYPRQLFNLPATAQLQPYP